MTNQTIRIPIGQAIGGVVNTDEAVASINLRLSSGGAAVYNGTHIGDGVYEFTGVASGSYKVFSGSTELTKISWVVVGETGTILASQISGVINIANIPTSIPATSVADGSVTNAEFQRLDATSSIQTQFNTANTAIALRALDADVMHKTGAGETITSSKLFNAGGNIVVVGASSTAGYSTNYTVADNKSWVCLGHMTTYVNNQIQNYIAGNIPAFQLSGTYRRVIYNGTQELNRTYLSIADAVTNCQSIPAGVTLQFFVEITQDSDVRTSANTISSTQIDDYIHLFAVSNRIRIFGADDSFDGSAKKVQLTNLTIVWETGLTATPNFTGVVFQDCIFDIADNSIDFINCEFIGNCQVKRTTGTWTITNCIGAEMNADVYPTITGYSPAIKINGAYNQRELGIKGANIASGTNITAGTIGNTFTVTGTTNIETLSLTGWTEGSRVSLYFTGTLSVVHQASVTPGIFSNTSGANITTTAGTLLSYILIGTTWVQM